MSGKGKGLRMILALLLALAAMLVATGTALADELEQLDLKVNIVKDSKTKKEDAEAMQKGINAILGQCKDYGIHMEVTISTVETDVTKIGDLDPVPAENVTTAQQGEILTEAQKEAEKGQIKMVVLKSFAQPDPETTVLGSARMSDPTSEKPSATICDGAGADSWAHELGHALGLNDRNREPNNFMAQKKVRTDTKVDEDQCRTMKEFLKKRKAEARCTECQEKAGGCVPGAESANDAIFDERGDVTNPIVDVEATFFTFDLDPLSPTLFTTTGVGLFPDTPVSATYSIGFDTDNNAATGGTVGPFGGFEFAAVVQATGTFPFNSTAMGSLIKLPEGTEVTPLDSEFRRLLHHIDVEEGQIPPDEEIGAEIALAIPVTALAPLDDPIRVAVVASSGVDQDLVEPETINTLPGPAPELLVAPRTASPGEALTIEGSGFASNSDVRLVLADEPLGETATLGDGTFSTSAPTLSLGPGNYLLDAIDEEGNFGLEVITVLGPGGVGGIAEFFVDGCDTPASAAQGPGSSSPPYAALTAGLAVALAALTAGAWYARRRFSRS